MPIILDLVAIRIRHNTQGSREGCRAGGRACACEEQRRPDTGTRPCAGSFRRRIQRKVVQGTALSIGEDGFGFPIHRRRGRLHNGR